MSHKRAKEPELSGPSSKRVSTSSINANHSTSDPDSLEKKMKLWESRLKELWFEALGVSPLVLVDEIINAVNEHMYLMLSKIEMFVREFIPEDSVVDEVIRLSRKGFEFRF